MTIAPATLAAMAKLRIYMLTHDPSLQEGESPEAWSTRLEAWGQEVHQLAADVTAPPKPIPLKKGEVRYLGYRPELEACIYAIRSIDGMAPAPFAEALGARLRKEMQIAETLNDKAPMTRWAAYSGSAGGGDGISLHKTEWDALEQVATDLGLDDDPDVIAAISALDADALRELIQDHCNSGADDWAVQEVTIE